MAQLQVITLQAEMMSGFEKYNSGVFRRSIAEPCLDDMQRSLSTPFCRSRPAAIGHQNAVKFPPMFSVSIKGVFSAPSGEVVLLLNERGEWELPGGRIEIGESSVECLRREILEELNVVVSVESLLDTYLFEVIPDKHVFIVTYGCRRANEFNPVISYEHKRIGLFDLTALPQNLPAGYRASIEAWHANL